MSSSTALPLVMQLIVDRDLIKSGWTMGPMMAQAAHATAAVLVQSMGRPDTQAYVSAENLPNMHKIVLQAPKNVSLTELAAQLAAETHDEMPPYYLWHEQPENIPTCLAVAPNRKPECLKAILNKCTLLRA
ncbi:Hypothetical protein MSYG_0013 [Malassezia sympodialis ATCC 42132]|uniref:peptidyl-tRNA hydrolase n=1 Tax=Malassezia sympodialis (strain ATCC 42132) TaxID=1230383 RepID=A0A1M7ZZR8_MALS4|nr:Hypothetical protein MSYG_0013 [Malassezia sympodialis ATCC 42132]